MKAKESRKLSLDWQDPPTPTPKLCTEVQGRTIIALYIYLVFLNFQRKFTSTILLSANISLSALKYFLGIKMQF